MTEEELVNLADMEKAIKDGYFLRSEEEKWLIAIIRRLDTECSNLLERTEHREERKENFDER